MLKYNVYIPNLVGKSIASIPVDWKERIMKAISLLATNPFMGEKLWGKLQGKRKIRIHPYRIIYEVREKQRQIIITSVGHRQGIY
jgi:addiction module RelE/StbE family toxin